MDSVAATNRNALKNKAKWKLIKNAIFLVFVFGVT